MPRVGEIMNALADVFGRYDGRSELAVTALASDGS